MARAKANTAQTGVSHHLVDEGPIELAGHPAWWTIASVAADGPAHVVERRLLVRDAVAWTVNVQMPWR